MLRLPDTQCVIFNEGASDDGLLGRMALNDEGWGASPREISTRSRGGALGLQLISI